MQAVRSRTTAEAQQSYFEGDKERLVREQASTKQRLDALNRQLEDAIQDRDAFELEASKAKRELTLVQEERSVLQVCMPVACRQCIVGGAMWHSMLSASISIAWRRLSKANKLQ